MGSDWKLQAECFCNLILYWLRDWFLSQELSQKWLVGLQLFRVIGGVFLIEMVRGNIPGIFSYPAGIGDILVGVAALAVLLAYRKREHIPGTRPGISVGLSQTTRAGAGWSPGRGL